MPETPYPTDITLHQQAQTLELGFSDGTTFHLPSEYLRVFSPSAEVQGHNGQNAVLQTGKIHVRLLDVRPIGQYAVKLVFDDGHDSGLYTWPYLYALGTQHTVNWQGYLTRLAAAQASRSPT